MCNRKIDNDCFSLFKYLCIYNTYTCVYAGVLAYIHTVCSQFQKYKSSESKIHERQKQFKEETGILIVSLEENEIPFMTEKQLVILNNRSAEAGDDCNKNDKEKEKRKPFKFSLHLTCRKEIQMKAEQNDGI